MSSKTKTFEAESEFGEVIDWFIHQIETKDHEIIVEVRTTKKYRITIHEFWVKSKKDEDNK